MEKKNTELKKHNIKMIKKKKKTLYGLRDEQIEFPFLTLMNE
jgi:hypothetical protein